MCKSIIYIDDSEFEHFNVEILVKEHSECDIQCFLNGREALNLLTENKNDESGIPDVIFLDLSMPEYTGWDFLEDFSKVRVNLCKQPYIYILSSNDDEESINRSTTYSFVKRFIPKPLTRDIFEEVYQLYKTL
jgi:response regulator RpfG family c-di-GMP phosphodiesterase